MRHKSFAMAAGIAVLICAAASAPAQTPEGTATPPSNEAAPAPPADAAPPSVAAPAPSPPSMPPGPPARFTFNRVDDGFLRLDSETGQVAICSQRAVGWGCQAVPEDRAALEKEIARLQAEGASRKDEAASLKNEIANLKNEITSLKVDIAVLREPPPPRPPAELTPPPAKNDDANIKMPTREDIERARVALENAWRRIVNTIQNLHKDVMGKG